MKRNYTYPFVAIIAQDEVKKAIILNIINPLIGGVLISGEKGTAKSTLVRGLGKLLSNKKVIELPLNTTEDRLIGTIDIENAMINGKRGLEEGILKKAHKNILYVDEINLLSEHIINCILQVSSSKVNHVEREGISYSHASDFILIGTMNPEEGSLRRDFSDKFGLYIEVKGSNSLEERKEIIKRRLQYEKNPIEYINLWNEESNRIQNNIFKAKDFISKVKVSDSIMNLAVQISEKSNCEGHRAEIIMIETAKAIASLENKQNVNIEHIKEAAKYVLPHRMRELPKNSDEHNEENMKDNKSENSEKQNDKVDNNELDKNNNSKKQPDELDNNEKGSLNNKEKEENKPKYTKDMDDNIEDIGRVFKVKSLNIKPMDRKKRNGSGKRNSTKTSLIQGTYVKYTFPKGKLRDIAFDATLRAAAPYQKLREKEGLAIAIKSTDFREKVRERRVGSTILFVVDASGSMGAKKRMKAVKGAIVSLLMDAYQKRDKVGMIAFRKNSAEVLLNITRSVELAEKSLKILPTGGKTPLAEGLLKAYEIFKIAKKKDEDMIPIMVLISDGRANFSKNGSDSIKAAINVSKMICKEKIQSIIIDTEQDFIKLELAKKIAQALNGKYYKLEEIESGEIEKTVRTYI